MIRIDIEKVIAGPVFGNAYSDGDTWNLLYAVAFDRSRPVAERAKAVRHMDVLTGCHESEGFDDAALVESFEASMLKDLEVTPEDGLRDALSRLFVKDISQFLV